MVKLIEFKMIELLKYKFTTVCFTIITLLLNTVEMVAQCPMCRAAAEQNLASGGGAARGLNHGILYLLAAPYLIVSIIGIIWYYQYRKSQRLTVEDILGE